MAIDPAVCQKYPKDVVDKAVEYLSYKTASALPKATSDTPPVLYIFRHGQTTDNADFLFSGWRDVDLTQQGIDQALALAEKLKTKTFNMLISSPQKRAVHTMELAVSLNPTAKDLTITTDERIKERCYGDLQGHSKLELYLADPKLAELERRSYAFVPPNGESIEMVCKRVEAFCSDIVKTMREKKVNVAISCHGNSFRGFRKYFEQLTPDQTAKLETPLGQDYASYSIN